MKNLEPNRKTHHVLPNLDGGWSVKKGGAARSSKNFTRKEEALKFARQISKKNESKLVVHRKDGTIQGIDKKHSTRQVRRTK